MPSRAPAFVQVVFKAVIAALVVPPSYRRLMKVEVTENIDVPRARVFDLMADARNEPSWNTQVASVELRTSEPIGLGSSFTTVYRGLTYAVTVTDHERPSRLEFSVNGKLLTISPRFSFAESGGSTRLRAEFDVQPRGPMKVLLPLMGRLVRRDFITQLANFTRFCESNDQDRAKS